MNIGNFPSSPPKGTHIMLRPSFPLANNIISHSIKPSKFIRIMNLYNIEPENCKVITRYHNYDQIMEVDEDREIKCYTISILETYTNYTLGIEVTSIDKHDYPRLNFPLNINYHHERQSIVFTKILQPGIKIHLEILVHGIIDPKERKSQITNIMDCLDDVISLSYQLIVSDPCKYSLALKQLDSLQ